MRIQGIAIEVGDLAASKDFYENVLGFQPGEILRTDEVAAV